MKKEGSCRFLLVNFKLKFQIREQIRKPIAIGQLTVGDKQCGCYQRAGAVVAKLLWFEGH